MLTQVASQIEQARILVIDRYGECVERQEPSTGKWWIVSVAGMILGNGETSDEAWVSSAFMTSAPHATAFPD